MLWITFYAGWLPPVLVENDSSPLILNKWGYCRDYRDLCLWFEEGARFQMHSCWRRTFKCYFMQLTAWHGAQCCWVEVIISLKCLGGCLQGMTSYAVARGKENSITLTKALTLNYSCGKGADLRLKLIKLFRLSSTCPFFLLWEPAIKITTEASLKVAFQQSFGTQLRHDLQWKQWRAEFPLNSVSRGQRTSFYQEDRCALAQHLKVHKVTGIL